MAEDPDLHWKALLRHHQLRKPLIAAVEGYAVAGGTEILQGTDIRVAGESAVFGLFEAKRGLYPLGGSVVRLVRQIPYTVAMDLLLTARSMSATEAKEVGLIGYVVPDGSALDKALEIADVIGSNGPLAVEAIKASLRATDGMSEATRWRPTWRSAGPSSPRRTPPRGCGPSPRSARLSTRARERPCRRRPADVDPGRPPGRGPAAPGRSAAPAHHPDGVGNARRRCPACRGRDRRAPGCGPGGECRHRPPRAAAARRQPSDGRVLPDEPRSRDPQPCRPAAPTRGGRRRGRRAVRDPGRGLVRLPLRGPAELRARRGHRRHLRRDPGRCHHGRRATPA